MKEEKMNIKIEEVKIDKLNEILHVHIDAFTGYGEDAIEVLVKDLFNDSSATPIISFMAYDGDRAVGHIIFTKGTVDNSKNNLNIYILAPLAVIKTYQNKGIGRKLIEAGINKLKEIGADIAFVLGHTRYYPKYGFVNNAIKDIGYKATFDIPEENYDAWMYMPLNTSVEDIRKNPGRIICCNSMNKIDYWVE